MKFNEFLSADPEDFESIFDYYLEFLSEFSKSNFPFESQIKLKPAGKKFIGTVVRFDYNNRGSEEEYLKMIDTFNDRLNYYRRSEKRNFLYNFAYKLLTLYHTSGTLLLVQQTFQELYSKSSDFISNIANKKIYFYDDLHVNNLFDFDKSNKEEIKNLLIEATDLINSDKSLNEKSKKIINNYLDTAIKELDRKYVNWVKFLGRIKETIIILGALGSLAGGASVLFHVQEKLDQATVIIQKTSININYTTINETFNIDHIQRTGPIYNLLSLPEKSENNDDSDNSDDDN